MDLLGMAAGGALSFARDMANSAVQYYNQKKLNRQAQNDTQQNMKLQKQLNLEQQFDSLKAYTSGLRAAGLNPALASSSPVMAQGVSSAAGNAGQAALPQNTTAETLQAFNALRKADSEIENVEANTELQRAETKLKEQDVKNKQQDIEESKSRVALNSQQESMLVDLSKKYQTESLILGTEFSRMLSQDSFAHVAMMDLCNRRIEGAQDEWTRDYWTGLRALGQRNKFDVGAVMAMSLWSEAWNSLDKTEQEIGARAILRQIQDIQIADNEFLDIVAHMPVYQAALVFGQTAEAFQNAAFRKAYRKDLLPAEKDKLEEDIRVQKHNDPAGMLKDGDYLGFGIYGAGQVLRWIPQFYMARQFGKGGSLSNPQGKQPNGRPKAPEAGKTSDGKTPPRIDTRSDTAVKQSVSVRLGQARTDALYDEFLKTGYRSKTGNNSFSEWLVKEKHIGR